MMSSAGTLAMALVFALAMLSAASAKSLPHPLRPDGAKTEDAAFWRDYGDRDLRRRLEVRPNVGRAKNVIIFVGDGMGVQTVTMARVYKGQKEGKSGEETELLWESFPVTGLSKTYNTDFQVPDSAGTATALFSGVKTSMGVLGVDSRMAYNVCDPTVLERSTVAGMLHWAQEAGKETGLVTTARVTHATPGALYAHVANRDWEADGVTPDGRCTDIAKQLVEGQPGEDIKVILGGGRRNFVGPREGGRRKGDGDLLAVFKDKKGDKGAVLRNSGDFRRWRSSKTEYVLGLFTDSHVPYEVDRDKSENGTPSIAEMTAAAIERLSQSKNGFFLMVEGARIDHAHHENNAYRALDDVVAMEEALKAAMDLVNLEETLIVVTADHSHSVTMNGYPERGNSIFGHIYDEARDLVVQYADGTKHAYPTISYANGPGYYKHHVNHSHVPWVDVKELGDSVKDVDYLQPAMMPGPGTKSDRSETHGGEDVAVYAAGPMAHLLGGVHEQSFIAEVMAYASCVGRHRDNCPPAVSAALVSSAASTTSLAATLAPLAISIALWY